IDSSQILFTFRAWRVVASTAWRNESEYIGANRKQFFTVDRAFPNPYRERQCMNDSSRPNENSTMAEEHQPPTGPGGITPETGIQALPATDTGIQTLPEGGAAPTASTPPLEDVSLKKPEPRLAFLDLVLAT